MEMWRLVSGVGGNKRADAAAATAGGGDRGVGGVGEYSAAAVAAAARARATGGMFALSDAASASRDLAPPPCVACCDLAQPAAWWSSSSSSSCALTPAFGAGGASRCACDASLRALAAHLRKAPDAKALRRDLGKLLAAASLLRKPSEDDAAAGERASQVRSIHWFPYDRVGVVNADP
jgi:hypothetical protein